MSNPSKKVIEIDHYEKGVLSGDRIILSQAITLVESNRVKDQEMAEVLIDRILAKTGNSVRIGITGVPGVGKSTFIESFGLNLIEEGKSLAVLTIDPTSQISRGSILGDKTRMEKLSVNPNAYIRPSASGEALGGVTSRSREAMLLCEAAGFDIVIIETVGVGQSETTVFGMVDFFLLLMLAGAGDELQGMKRGIMEMADGIAITKADGDNIDKSELARAEFQSALHLMPPKPSGWTPSVTTCSAIENHGISKIWGLINEHRNNLESKGLFTDFRKEQNLTWFRDMIQWQLNHSFMQHAAVRDSIHTIERQVRSGSLAANAAAKALIQMYHSGPS